MILVKTCHSISPLPLYLEYTVNYNTTKEIHHYIPPLQEELEDTVNYNTTKEIHHSMPPLQVT